MAAIWTRLTTLRCFLTLAGSTWSCTCSSSDLCLSSHLVASPKGRMVSAFWSGIDNPVGIRGDTNIRTMFGKAAARRREISSLSVEEVPVFAQRYLKAPRFQISASTSSNDWCLQAPLMGQFDTDTNSSSSNDATADVRTPMLDPASSPRQPPARATASKAKCARGSSVGKATHANRGRSGRHLSTLNAPTLARPFSR